MSDTMLNLKKFQEKEDTIQSSTIQSFINELVKNTQGIQELYIQEDESRNYERLI